MTECPNCSQLQKELAHAEIRMREAANKIAAAKSLLQYAERKAGYYEQALLVEVARLLTEAERRLKP